jgi:hypothetical protein
MDVAIEGDALVFWRLEWPLPERKREKHEYLRFNLKNLPLLLSP